MSNVRLAAERLTLLVPGWTSHDTNRDGGVRVNGAWAANLIERQSRALNGLVHDLRPIATDAEDYARLLREVHPQSAEIVRSLAVRVRGAITKAENEAMP